MFIPAKSLPSSTNPTTWPPTAAHVSTIYREIKRNFFFDDDRFYRGYFPLTADDEARERRARTGKIHRNSELAAYVTDRLQDCWSPEQIAGYLKHHGTGGLYACHETIYRYVYSRDGHAQELYRLLPVARRRRRPRRSRRPRGPQIPLANTIAMRPAEISAPASAIGKQISSNSRKSMARQT